MTRVCEINQGDFSPYDLFRSCAKCGAGDRWNPAQTEHGRYYSETFEKMSESEVILHNCEIIFGAKEADLELLRRTCTVCGYQWYERPIDAEDG